MCTMTVPETIPRPAVSRRQLLASTGTFAAGGGLVAALDVAPEGTDNYQTIDQLEETASAASGAGQYSLSGSVVAHDALDYATFSADTAERVEYELPVRVVLDVLHGGESVVTAMATTVALIEVSNTGVEASAAVTGEGEIAVEV